MTPTNHKDLVKKLLAAAIALAALIVPAAAAAHPLGNFTTNHFTRIEVAGDRVYLTYVLDLAEIPTFQEQRHCPSARRGRLRAAAPPPTSPRQLR